MDITTLGIDLAKSVFQLHGVNAQGVIVLQKKLRRGAVVKFLSKLEPCLIGIEGAVRRMRTRIRLQAQPEPMRSIVGATQQEQRHG